MRAVEAAINIDRTVPFSLNARYYFVDRKKQYISYLENRIREYGFSRLLEQDFCKCIVGEFSDKVDAIITDVNQKGRGKHSIFLLDQYGYIDATLGLIKKIFDNVSGAEVILTFAADKLIDFFNTSEKYTGLMKRLGIDPTKSDVTTNRGQMIWRYQMESWIAKQLHEESGAKYFTRFFIVSSKSNRAYWLLHYSNHLRAHDEMVRIHWAVQNHFAHYGTAGINKFPILGFDPERIGFQELNFDADAKTLSHDALLEDLPPIAHAHRDGIRVDALRAIIANHTPADMNILKNVFNQLRDQKIWEIRTEVGGERRSANGIRGTDIIIPTQQMGLFL